MSYHNLTNEEIVFIFLFCKSIKEQYESVFESKSISQNIPTELGTMKVETIIPNEVVSEMLEAKHYVLMNSVYNKLKPLYELISEVEPEVVAEIKIIFEKI